MRLVLAHGASGSAASMRAHVSGLAALGVEATAIDLPVRRAEDAVDAYQQALRTVAGDDRAPAIGGHSYGGRVASLVAARGDAPCAALVLFSYPLHRPGHPEWEARTLHWPAIGVPVLLLSGEADPFARVDLLRIAVASRLASAELVTFPRLGHTLTPVLGTALERVADFLGRVRDAGAGAR
jgi:hypothetical protein